MTLINLGYLCVSVWLSAVIVADSRPIRSKLRCSVTLCNFRRLLISVPNLVSFFHSVQLHHLQWVASTNLPANGRICWIINNSDVHCWTLLQVFTLVHSGSVESHWRDGSLQVAMHRYLSPLIVIIISRRQNGRRARKTVWYYKTKTWRQRALDYFDDWTPSVTIDCQMARLSRWFHARGRCTASIPALPTTSRLPPANTVLTHSSTFLPLHLMWPAVMYRSNYFKTLNCTLFIAPHMALIAK